MSQKKGLHVIDRVYLWVKFDGLAWPVFGGWLPHFQTDPNIRVFIFHDILIYSHQIVGCIPTFSWYPQYPPVIKMWLEIHFFISHSSITSQKTTMCRIFMDFHGSSWIFMDFLWGLDDTRGFSPWISHKFLPCWRRSKEGWPETLDFIRKVWTEEGPFDGILGFSQGPFETLDFFGSGGVLYGYGSIPINTY